MSNMRIEKLFFEEREVGKTISATKKYYKWEFILNGKPHKVEMYHSRMSKKKKMCVDDKVVVEDQEYKNNFEYSFILSGNRFTVIQLKSDKFDLRVNGITFAMLMVEEKNGNLNKKSNDNNNTNVKRTMSYNINKPNSKFEMVPSFLRSKATHLEPRTNEQQNNVSQSTNQSNNVLFDFGGTTQPQQNNDVFKSNLNILSNLDNVFGEDSQNTQNIPQNNFNQINFDNIIPSTQDSTPSNAFNNDNIVSNNSNILNNLNTNAIFDIPQSQQQPQPQSINTNPQMNSMQSFSPFPPQNPQILSMNTNSFNTNTNMNMNMGNISTYPSNYTTTNSQINSGNNMNITWNTQNLQHIAANIDSPVMVDNTPKNQNVFDFSNPSPNTQQQVQPVQEGNQFKQTLIKSGLVNLDNLVGENYQNNTLGNQQQFNFSLGQQQNNNQMYGNNNIDNNNMNQFASTESSPFDF